MTVILSMIVIVLITRLTTRIVFLEEKNRKEEYIRKVEKYYQKIMIDEAHYD